MLNRESSIPVYSAGITKVRMRGHSTCGKQAKIQGGLFFSINFSLVLADLEKFTPLLLFCSPGQVKRKSLTKTSAQHIHLQLLGAVSAGRRLSMGLSLELGQVGGFFNVRKCCGHHIPGLPTQVLPLGIASDPLKLVFDGLLGAPGISGHEILTFVII